MKKRVFCSELAYVLGIVLLALGAAFMERGDFGMSMVVAPAYLLHLRISQILPFYSFGMSEYVLQAVVLAALALVMGRFRRGYFFSFVTAVIYGLTLDGCVALTALIPQELGGLWWRLGFYAAGFVLCGAGVSLLFHTYLPPEAYELFVKELSGRLGADIGRVKTVYDLCSCAVSVLLSFAFFGLGRFEGVKAGTIICAFLNGRLISLFSRLEDRLFDFRDALPWRGFFES